MAAVGSIALTLKARTEKFRQEMRKSGSSVAKFANKAKMGVLAAGALGTAMATAAAAGLGVWVKNSLAAGDELGKLSDRLRIGVTDLQGLERAAELTGAGVGVMRKGLEFLAKSLGEATTGVGEARQALDILGLEVDTLLAMDPAEQFKTIAEAVSKLERQEMKAFAATKLFGRAGVALVNTLDLGRAGIQQSIDELKAWGVEIDRVDLANIERANDRLADVGRMIDILGMKFSAELAPFIEAAAKKAVEWGSEFFSNGERVNAVIETITTTTKTVTNVTATWLGTVTTLGAGAIEITARFAQVLGEVLNAQERLKEFTTLGLVDTNIGRGIAEEAKGIADAAADVRRAGQELLEAGASGDAGQAVVDVFADIKDEADRISEAIAAAADEARGAGGAFEGMGTKGKAAAQGMTEEMRRAVEEQRKLKSATEKFWDLVFKNSPTYAKLNEELGEHTALFLELVNSGAHEYAEQLREMVKSWKDQNKEAEKQAEAIKKQKKAIVERARQTQEEREATVKQRETVREYERQIERLKAVNDEERRAIDNAERRERIIKKIGEELGNQIADQIEAAEAANRAAEAAERAGEAAKQKAKADAESAKSAQEAAAAAIQQGNSIKRMADITQRFARVGHSIFGFGAGQVGTGLGNILAPVTVRQRKKPQGKSKQADSSAAEKKVAKEVEEAVGKIKDLSPAMQSVRDAILKISNTHHMMANEVERLGVATDSSVDQIIRVTESFASRVDVRIQGLESKINAFERRLDRAGRS